MAKKERHSEAGGKGNKSERKLTRDREEAIKLRTLGLLISLHEVISTGTTCCHFTTSRRVSLRRSVTQGGIFQLIYLSASTFYTIVITGLSQGYHSGKPGPWSAYHKFCCAVCEYWEGHKNSHRNIHLYVLMWVIWDTHGVGDMDKMCCTKMLMILQIWRVITIFK